MRFDQSNIKARVNQLFSDVENQEYAEEFLKELRENWRETQSALARTIGFIVLLAGAFELLVRAAISSVSIGPFELNDLSLIRKALPLVIAYLFYDVLLLTSRYYVFAAVHRSMMDVLHKDLFRHGFDLLLEPREHSLAQPELLGYQKSRFIAAVNALLVWSILVFGVLMFEIYAYYVQFSKFGLHDPFTWLTLILTIMLLAAAYSLSYYFPDMPS